MKVLFEVFLIIHFIGWAIVLGGYLTSLRKPGLPKGVFHGAATALVAGIVMAALLGSKPHLLGYDVSNAALTVKLVVALVVTALAFVAQRRGDKTPDWVKHGVGLLTVVNIVVAVFWL